VQLNLAHTPLPQSKAQAEYHCVWTCTAGELLKWKVIVVFPLLNTNELAGVPFTVKSLHQQCLDLRPAQVDRDSVGGVPTTTLPQPELITEQPVELGWRWCIYQLPIGEGIRLVCTIDGHPRIHP